MNWYFEKDGISMGPLLEPDLTARIQRGEVKAETLIWHDGMGEWLPVVQVSPDWLKPVPKTAHPVPAEEPVKEAKSKTSSKRKTATAPIEVAPEKPKAASSKKTKPVAPSEPAPKPVEEPEEKPGFFGRLFGKGKKKK